eukprot:COSAG03_NODE_5275_length_1290_cov_2.669186_2_plen_94_part_00
MIAASVGYKKVSLSLYIYIYIYISIFLSLYPSLSLSLFSHTHTHTQANKEYAERIQALETELRHERALRIDIEHSRDQGINSPSSIHCGHIQH